MASAIAQGLFAKGDFQIAVSDPHTLAMERWQTDFKAERFQNQSVDAVIIAVKPQQFAEAAAALKVTLSPNTLVISVMAGIPTSKISATLNGHACVVRTMPNTPARIAQGITALYATNACTAKQTELAQTIVASIGQTVWLQDESLIDAVTAVSGSGPSYVFYIAQALADAGAALGLPAETAKQLALATLQGSAALALHTGEDLGALREQVTSKGGTTAAALGVFRHAQLDETLKAAVRAAHSRAQELASQAT